VIGEAPVKSFPVTAQAVFFILIIPPPLQHPPQRVDKLKSNKTECGQSRSTPYFTGAGEVSGHVNFC
jgi:hypothetical protein